MIEIVEYHTTLKEAAELSYAVAYKNIERHEWLAVKVAELLGEDHPATGKRFSQSAADQFARNLPDHRAMEREQAILQRDAELARAKGRAMEMSLRFQLSAKEAV